MGLDLHLLGDKLRRYRNQFELGVAEVSASTGIDSQSINAFEQGKKAPSGDDLLILADFYKCDYKFFISNERLAPFEQTEILFRRFGDQFSRQDRWAVQEFLFLAECEHFLQKSLEKLPDKKFTFQKKGNNYKEEAERAATSLREFLGYSKREVLDNIYRDLRAIGLHIFRRRLENSNISGLYMKHPVAGSCILINYSEDIYRQRFTTAHETGHSILDDDEDVVVSFNLQKGKQEMRANAFASRLLMPPELLCSIPESNNWDAEKGIEWASKLKVSTQALAYALTKARLINQQTQAIIKSVRVPKKAKIDPELPDTLSTRSRARKLELLERGLSNYYVNLCFDAYRSTVISASRLAEMLLLSGDSELRELAGLYGETLQYGN